MQKRLVSKPTIYVIIFFIITLSLIFFVKHLNVNVNKLISYQERTCTYASLQCFSFWFSEYAIEILLNLLCWLVNLTLINFNFYRSKCFDWHMIHKKYVYINYESKLCQKTTKKNQQSSRNALGEKTIWILHVKG